MRIVRLTDRPIVGPDSHPSIGANLNGPSLIKVPIWIPDPLGAYYLYFSHHKGDHIRMAYADDLTGPWTVHPGGVLALADSRFLTEPPEATAEEIAFIEQCYIDALGEHELPNGLLADITIPHIASPDVRVNDSYRTITMYFHGLEGLGNQLTRHATSLDGLRFDVDPPKIEETYLRGFRHNETEYAIVMPGKILRRVGRPTEFEEGPNLLPRTARHTASRRGRRSDSVVLDARGRHARTNPVEHDRRKSSVDRMGSVPVGRNPASGVRLGGCKRGADSLDSQ